MLGGSIVLGFWMHASWMVDTKSRNIFAVSFLMRLCGVSLVLSNPLWIRWHHSCKMWNVNLRHTHKREADKREKKKQVKKIIIMWIDFDSTSQKCAKFVLKLNRMTGKYSTNTRVPVCGTMAKRRQLFYSSGLRRLFFTTLVVIEAKSQKNRHEFFD